MGSEAPNDLVGPLSISHNDKVCIGKSLLLAIFDSFCLQLSLTMSAQSNYLLIWVTLKACVLFVLFLVNYCFRGNTMHYLLHGCHHKHPMDGLRLVFPPTATAILLFPVSSMPYYILLSFIIYLLLRELWDFKFLLSQKVYLFFFIFLLCLNRNLACLSFLVLLLSQ